MQQANDTYTKLAKNVAEHFVTKNETLPVPPHLSLELSRQLACYIYLYQRPGQRLSAMFGRPLPQYSSLAEEITHNTVQALSSSSYLTVRQSDLSALSYSVAVLDSLQRISDPTWLQPMHYGLYITSDLGRTAVVLPQRPGIETPQGQIATALRESGINERRESVTMYRFAVTYYE